jgi:hypothetical protein
MTNTSQLIKIDEFLIISKFKEENSDLFKNYLV